MRWLMLMLMMIATSAQASEVNLSTPKDAAKTLFTAVAAGDRDGIRAALHASDAQQDALADAMAQLIVSGKRLGDAASLKFGAEGDALGRGMLDPSGLSRLDGATVSESGDNATLEVPGQNRPMSFRKQDGKWRLVITNFGGALPEHIEKQTRLVILMAEAMDESTAEIGAGKFATVTDAAGAIQKRLHGVMLKFNRPGTTQSTTQPSTTQRSTQPTTQPTSAPAQP